VNPEFTLSRENPWPGLQSFTEEGKDFFFGRRDETESLLRLIRRERLTVFYGQSGLGKSSLLRAGLFPQLRPLNLLPVPLRLDYSNEAPPLTEQVKQALVEVFRANQIEARPPETSESLWAYFHRDDLDFWDSRNRLVTPVLVFDQFEERFTLGRRNEQTDAKADAFLSDLSQLVENRPPSALRAKFETNPDAALAYDFDKQTCKVVLSLREDFLPELDGLRDRFPAISNNRFRLLPMSKAQALDVVRQPGSNLVSLEVASAIVDFVAFSRQQRAGGEVEPALLSLVLQELNARRQQQGHGQISADLLSGSKDKILEDFYEQAVKDLPPQARTFIEDGLLTSSGYRDSIALEDVRAEFGLDDACLSSLVNRHLVRREERLGSTRLELVHDLLTRVIAESRKRRHDRIRLAKEIENEWKIKNVSLVRATERLNASADEWSRDGQVSRHLLLKRAALCQAFELVQSHPDLLNPNTSIFVAESVRALRKGRWLWIAIAICLGVLGGVGVVRSQPSGQRELIEGLVTCLLLFSPPLLIALDKWPLRYSKRILAAAAWRWTVFTWLAFVPLCVLYFHADSRIEFFAGVLIMGLIFLLSLPKWNVYQASCQLALERTAQKTQQPLVATIVSGVLLLMVAMFGSTNATPTEQRQPHYTYAVDLKYDKQWRLLEKTHFNAQGDAILADGYHRRVIEYDPDGLIVSDIRFDTQGKAPWNMPCKTPPYRRMCFWTSRTNGPGKISRPPCDGVRAWNLARPRTWR
jgi:hypothetical protein